MSKICCKGLIIFLLLFPFSLFSQDDSYAVLTSPLVEWDKTIHNEANSSVREIIATSDGGYVMTGGFITKKYLVEVYDKEVGGSYSIMKIDSIGNVLWHKVFNTDGHDVLLATIQTRDNGFLLGGKSMSSAFGDKSEPNKGHHDYWVIKIDANGNKQWDKSFGGGGADYLWALGQTPDGGYLLAGESFSSAGGDKSDENNGGGDAWIVKIDSLGNKVWDRAFGGWSADVCGSILVNNDGSALLGCISSSFNSYGEDYWVIKIDAQGNQLWDKNFLFGHLRHVSPADDQGYILVGDKLGAEGGCWIIKVDSLGNKEWDKIIGGNQGDFVHQAISTDNENIIIGLKSYSGASGDKSEENRGIYDFWIVKIDFSGNIIWDKTAGGNKEDYLSSLSAIKDGGIIAAGYSESDISGEKTEKNVSPRDIWIVKLNNEENIQYPIVRDIPTDVTAYADADSCGTHVSWKKPFVFNPQLFPFTTAHPPGSFFSVGKTKVTYTVKDRQGKATDYAFNVTVKDTVPPEPVLASLPAIVENCSVIEVPTPTALDKCTGTIQGTTTDPVVYEQSGIYTITWQYQDEKGNTSYQLQQVTIADTVPPVPLQDALPVIQGDCEVSINEIPEAEDNCSGRIPGTTKDGLNYDQPGEYFITWHYTDSTSNQTQQKQKVIVGHNHAPVPQLDTLPTLTGLCEVNIQDKPLAITSCDQTITAITEDPLQYDKEGTYAVHWTYEDELGNTTVQTQIVEIKDTLSPIPHVANLPEIVADCNITLEDIPLAWDRCDGELTATTSDPQYYEKTGEHIIHWIFTDSNGNTSRQEQKVIIACEEDTILTHVEELKDNRSVNLFPNPVQDEVVLSLPAQYNKKILETDVYHLSGKLLRTTNITIEDDQTMLSLVNLPKGVYIIKIRDQGKHVLTTRILKE